MSTMLLLCIARKKMAGALQRYSIIFFASVEKNYINTTGSLLMIPQQLRTHTQTHLDVEGS